MWNVRLDVVRSFAHIKASVSHLSPTDPEIVKECCRGFTWTATDFLHRLLTFEEIVSSTMVLGIGPFSGVVH